MFPGFFLLSLEFFVLTKKKKRLRRPDRLCSTGNNLEGMEPLIRFQVHGQQRLRESSAGPSVIKAERSGGERSGGGRQYSYLHSLVEEDCEEAQFACVWPSFSAKLALSGLSWRSNSLHPARPMKPLFGALDGIDLR